MEQAAITFTYAGYALDIHIDAVEQMLVITYWKR
jgi:hypothetical protein